MMKCEDVFYGQVEDPCNAECQFQRWTVLRFLDGDDGLPGDAYAVGQVFLRHLVMVETQPANVVGNQCLAHVRHPADSR